MITLKDISISFTLVILSASLCLVANSHAATSNAKPDCSRTLSLAYHDHGMLYSKRLDQGIDKDIALEMIRRSGCKFNISVMPRSRIWQWIKSGQLDFSMSGITSKQRDKFADFAWYLDNKYYLLVRKDTHVSTLKEFENRKDLYIGTIRSFRYSKNANQLVDRLTAESRNFEVPDHAQLLSMIKRNRIQGMIIEPFNYTQVDSRALHKITRVIDTGDAPVLHGLIMSRKSLPETERNKWRAIINDMHKDGTLLKILEKYFDKATAKAMLNF